MANVNDELMKMLAKQIELRQAQRNVPPPRMTTEPVAAPVPAPEPVPVPEVTPKPVLAIVPDAPEPVTPEHPARALENRVAPTPVPAPEPEVAPVPEPEVVPVPEPEVAPIAPAATAEPAAGTTRERLLRIVAHLSRTHKEREGLARTAVIAAIARQHLLMLSKPGTGKSYLVDDFVRHLEDAKLFKIAVDEGTVPDEVNGDPNVKALVEEGQMRRNTRNKLPQAEVAFIDEFFNANTPTLHSIMPILNERIFTNGDSEPEEVPLRFAFAATNKLTDDPDLAAVMDRLHHRVLVDYVRSESLLREMAQESLDRRVHGWAPPVATVTLAELDDAHDEAMMLPASEEAWQAWTDLTKLLPREGVEVSSRRWVEVMAAAHAAAWLAGHDQVEVRDLAVAVDMLWRTIEEADKVRRVVMDRVDPEAGKVVDIAIDLSAMVEEYAAVKGDQQLDDMHREAAAIRIFTKAQKKLDEVPADFDPRFGTVLRAGLDLLVLIGKEQYSMSPDRVLATVPTHLRTLLAA